MNQTPTVSVIVPTYNRVNYLMESLKSILDQTFIDFEIVVTDNASSDDTELSVKSIGDSRIIYKKNATNLGIAENHNVALRICRGKYIHFFSDDDIMLENCLEDRVRILDKYPSVGLVHSDVKLIDEKGQLSSENHWAANSWMYWTKLHSADRFFNGKSYHKYLYKINNIISMPSVMVRAAAVELVGLIDPKLKIFIDYDYWLKVTLFYDVYFLKEKSVLYRVHPNATSVREWSTKANQLEVAYLQKALRKKFPNRALISNNRFDVIKQNLGFYTDYNYVTLVVNVFKALIKRMLKIKVAVASS